MTPKSPYRRGCLAPRCRLIASWGWSRSQGYGCSPFKAVRELGSERRETVWSLSVVGVGNLRRPVLSTKGPEWTNLWCFSWFKKRPQLVSYVIIYNYNCKKISNALFISNFFYFNSLPFPFSSCISLSVPALSTLLSTGWRTGPSVFVLPLSSPLLSSSPLLLSSFFYI